MSGSWKCFVLAAVAALGLVSSASAGNIVITGHDDDFHYGGGFGDANAGNQLAAMAAFARMGAPNPTLPVLVFDHGTELSSGLTAKGIPNVRIDPDLGTPAAANFSTALYSAIAVASDETCGGCDNTATSIANLTNATSKANFANFVNAGGGVFAFAGASRASTYYGFLPSSASGFGSPPSSPYFQTADGLAAGIPAVNGDPTHNFFPEPGTGGVDPAYKVFERFGNATTGTAETLGLAGAIISVSGFVGVPEPGTLTLAGLALLGAAGYRLRRRKQNAA